MWLIGAEVYQHAAPWVKLFASVGNVLHCCGHHWHGLWPSIFGGRRYCGRQWPSRGHHWHGLWPSIFGGRRCCGHQWPSCGHHFLHCHGFWPSFLWPSLLWLPMTIMWPSLFMAFIVQLVLISCYFWHCKVHLGPDLIIEAFVGRSGRSTRTENSLGQPGKDSRQYRLRKQKNKDKDFLSRNIEVPYTYVTSVMAFPLPCCWSLKFRKDNNNINYDLSITEAACGSAKGKCNLVLRDFFISYT